MEYYKFITMWPSPATTSIGSIVQSRVSDNLLRVGSKERVHKPQGHSLPLNPQRLVLPAGIVAKNHHHPPNHLHNCILGHTSCSLLPSIPLPDRNDERERTCLGFKHNAAAQPCQPPIRPRNQINDVVKQLVWPFQQHDAQCGKLRIQPHQLRKHPLDVLWLGVVPILVAIVADHCLANHVAYKQTKTWGNQVKHGAYRHHGRIRLEDAARVRKQRLGSRHLLVHVDVIEKDRIRECNPNDDACHKNGETRWRQTAHAFEFLHWDSWVAHRAREEEESGKRTELLASHNVLGYATRVEMGKNSRKG
ncbi:hypothetical protein BCR44DRAFT_296900 [Catenaria anguillulae PL171]|uniref:Uncharacterized protein n=1 Tax=Catenaria anguillulae PL171 TaxID=765915 RepID=A0A1Y2HI80_9FUNG|nr:hypothetical protein BCR44DRAFT_296900 [Catenaria anguillulae PL171]